LSKAILAPFFAPHAHCLGIALVQGHLSSKSRIQRTRRWPSARARVPRPQGQGTSKAIRAPAHACNAHDVGLALVHESHAHKAKARLRPSDERDRMQRTRRWPSARARVLCPQGHGTCKAIRAPDIACNAHGVGLALMHESHAHKATARPRPSGLPLSHATHTSLA
jgi:hypothetical protein